MLKCFDSLDGVMRSLNNRRTLGLVGLLAVCIACQSPVNQPGSVISLPRSTVKIESLRQPQRVEHAVTLTGSVQQSLTILNSWLYQIDDGTGQVWILTDQSPPAVGDQIFVEGVVRYEPIVISGSDLGDYYLEEKQRQSFTPE